MEPGLESPLGGGFQDLAKAYSLSFARQRGQTQAVGDEAQATQQTENGQARIKQQVAALQAMTDPKAYRKVRKEDGGFDFVDPQGQKTDIATIVDRTGTRAADWIDDSENPIDVQYLNDYKNLQGFMNAVLSKDTAKIQEYEGTDPNLKQYTSGRGGIDRLMKQFKQTYQRYYKPSAWGAAPGEAVVKAPQSQSGGSNDAIMQQLGLSSY